MNTASEILIQEYLCDNLVFPRRTTQAKVGTDSFQIVDHPLCSDGNRFDLHYAVHVLSAKYSLEIQDSINLTWLAVGCTPLLRQL